MSRVLALNSDGKLTYCSVINNDQVKNKGRCNHIMHQKPEETNIDFYKRVEKELHKKEKEKLKERKEKALNKIIAKGVTIASLALVLSGCSDRTYRQTLNHIDNGVKIVKEIKKEYDKNANSKNSTTKQIQNNKEISIKNKNINELIDSIEIKEPIDIGYDRDLWGSNTPVYYYTDPLTGNEYKTNSSNRAGFYNSLHYNKETGEFTDPYDPTIVYTDYAGTGAKARELNQPDNVNYDHIIPLSYVAREIGGDDKWSAEKRNTYAYDLTAGVTASQHLNNVKGSKGPSEFLPPDEKAAIKYCYTWLVVADKYDIPLAPNDMQVIKETLSNANKEDIEIINPYYEGTDTDGTN